MRYEIDCTTGIETIREMTEEELKAEKIQQETQKKLDLVKAKLAAEAAAVKTKLLDRLGITEEEAKLLLS